jgi:hypothetical protein
MESRRACGHERQIARTTVSRPLLSYKADVIRPESSHPNQATDDRVV